MTMVVGFAPDGRGRAVLHLAAMLALTGPWMLRTLVEYTRNLIESIPGMIG